MQLGSDRILTAHVSSMPRPQDVVDLPCAQYLDDYPEYRDRLLALPGSYAAFARDRSL